jgi:uroporphyrinogen-III synthase
MLDARVPLKGRRVAVQEYGESNDAFLNGLATRGAEVMRVPVYRWALPEDVEPLRRAVRLICDQKADVLLFTSATQIDHVLKVAHELDAEASLRAAFSRCVIASVGPVCTERLRRHGVAVDIEPLHPKMGSLLAEASQKSRALLQRKRT